MQATGGEKALLDAAQNDLRMAVFNLVEERRHLGQSKWASLQFTEKSIKAKLASAGIPFPHSHKLSKLSDAGESAGLFQLDSKLLDKIQSGAAVRYGEETVTFSQAMAAHEASVSVVGSVFAIDGFSFDWEN